MKKIIFSLLVLVFFYTSAHAFGWGNAGWGVSSSSGSSAITDAIDNATAITLADAEDYTDAAIEALGLSDETGELDVQSVETKELTLTDPYGGAIMFSVPSNTMLPALYKGDGILHHKGVLYTRALIGGVMKYYTMAGAAVDNNVQERFFCDDTAGAYSMPTATGWANQVNGWQATVIVGTAPTITLDGTGTCVTMKSVVLAATTNNVNRVDMSPINGDTKANFTDGKAARVFFRVRFAPTGSNATKGADTVGNPHAVVGIQNDAGEDLIGVGVTYGGTGGTASTANVWTKNYGAAFDIYHTGVAIASATDFVDIEIALDGTTGFDVFIDGVNVCDESKTADHGADTMDIQTFANWDSFGGTEDSFNVGPYIAQRTSASNDNSQAQTIEIQHIIYQQAE